MKYRVWCSAALNADVALPTEFLVFRPGTTETSKGSFTVDVAAVMAAQKAYGVRLMIDSEHASLDPEVFKARGDARDALGYFDLEERADGSIWAVAVTWTPEGAERLRTKKAIYISPAFMAEDGCAKELINVALTSMPATHGAPALVAAARGCAYTSAGYTGGKRPQGPIKLNMDPKQVQAALDAIESGDQAKGLEILKGMIAAAAGGGAPADPGADAMSDTAATPAEDPNKPAELAALTARLSKLEADKAEAVKMLSARVAELEAEKATEENAERVALVGELVKLGYETPATAWEGEPEKLKPVVELRAMPIAKLRSRVELFRKSPRTNAEPAPLPGTTEIKLSKAEQDYCTKHGLTPEQFAARTKAAARVTTK